MGKTELIKKPENEPVMFFEDNLPTHKKIDPRIIALNEIYQNIPTGETDNCWFPETIEPTKSYQNIISRFEQVRDNLPDNKGIMIVETSSGYNPANEEYKSEFTHKVISLIKNQSVNEQVKEFLSPNWYVDYGIFVEEDSNIIKDNLFNNEGQNIGRFLNSQKPYKTTTKNKKEITKLRPQKRKEHLIKIYAMKRIQDLHNKGFKTSYTSVDNNKMSKELNSELNDLYKNPDNRMYSNYSLRMSKGKFDGDDAYYEAKNVFLLFDIIETLERFAK